MKTTLLLTALVSTLVVGCATRTPEQIAQDQALDRLYQSVTKSLAEKGYSTAPRGPDTYYHSYTGKHGGTVRCTTNVYAPGVASSSCR